MKVIVACAVEDAEGEPDCVISVCVGRGDADVEGELESVMATCVVEGEPEAAGEPVAAADALLEPDATDVGRKDVVGEADAEPDCVRTVAEGSAEDVARDASAEGEAKLVDVARDASAEGEAELVAAVYVGSAEGVAMEGSAVVEGAAEGESVKAIVRPPLTPPVPDKMSSSQLPLLPDPAE
jgi:hypothetical protein